MSSFRLHIRETATNTSNLSEEKAEYRQHQELPCEAEKQQQITDLDEGSGEFSLQIQVHNDVLEGFQE